MRGTWALAAMAVLLSGCTGSPPSGDGRMGGGLDAGGASGATGGPNLTLLVHALDANVSATAWGNGTFAAQEACNPAGCALDTYQHATDVSGLVPPGVPTRVRATLTYAAGPVSIGPPLFLFLNARDATIYRYSQEQPSSGEQRLEVLLLAGEAPDVAVYVDHYWPTLGGAAVSYTLRVDVEASRDVTPARVPVALGLGPGDLLVAEDPAGRGPLSLLLYGPDDALVARNASSSGRLELRLPSSLGEGEYVVLGGSDSADLRLSTSRPEGDLRALALSFAGGPARDATTHQPLQWAFTVEGTPLAVGLYAQISETTTGWTHTLDETATVASPEGTVAQGTFACQACLSFGEGIVYGVGSAIGDPKLVPGSYTARYEPQGSAGLQVAEFVVRYLR